MNGTNSTKIYTGSIFFLKTAAVFYTKTPIALFRIVTHATASFFQKKNKVSPLFFQIWSCWCPQVYDNW